MLSCFAVDFRKTYYVLPNLFTLSSVFCGFISISLSASGQGGVPGDLYQAALAICFGFFFDTADGRVARLTKTQTELGRDLDSLADLITFGVAPAFLTYAMTRTTVSEFWARPVQAVCVLYAMCALIRLARFTVETTPDESAHREFAGLPSPAAAGVMAAAVLPTVALDQLAPTLVKVLHAGLPGLALATGILMVSRVKYAHVVNRLLKGKRPFITLVEISLVIALFYVFREFAFFIAFFGYAVTGPLFWVKKHLFRRPVIASGAICSRIAPAIAGSVCTATGKRPGLSSATVQIVGRFDRVKNITLAGVRAPRAAKNASGYG